VGLRIACWDDCSNGSDVDALPSAEI